MPKTSKAKQGVLSNKPKQKLMTTDDAVRMMHNISTLVSRAAISSQLGKGFGGDREYYEIFGYPIEVSYDALWNMYDRDGITSRAGDGIAEETWRMSPVVVDGNAEWSDAEGSDEDNLTKFQKSLRAFDEKHHLFSLLMEADKMLSYSRFSCLYIGTSGKPVEKLSSAKEIGYFEALDEGSISVSAWEEDSTSERYGLPTKYSINLADSRIGVTADWSRVIHFKEGKERGSRYYGVPRLKKAYNYLLDLQKVIGGSSEAFWLLIRKGLALVARDGVDMPQPGTDEYKALQDEIEEYEHQLRRILRLRGVDIEDLGTDVPVADPQFRLLISALAGTIKTPQRILVGSEAGNLASSQDDKNWSDVVQSRQKNFAYPYMGSPAIQRLIDLGALPKPTSGSFSLKPPQLFDMTPLEKGTLAMDMSHAIDRITNGAPETVIDPNDFVTTFFGKQKARRTPEEQAAIESEAESRRKAGLNQPKQDNTIR
jgi:hypothetical protein